MGYERIAKGVISPPLPGFGRLANTTFGNAGRLDGWQEAEGGYRKEMERRKGGNATVLLCLPLLVHLPPPHSALPGSN